MMGMPPFAFREKSQVGKIRQAAERVSSFVYPFPMSRTWAREGLPNKWEVPRPIDQTTGSPCRGETLPPQANGPRSVAKDLET